MFIHDKKKAAGIIVSSMGKEPEVKEPGEEFEKTELHAIAEDMLAAIKSGSVEGLASALEAYMELDEAHDEAEHEEMMKG